ncbi:MAG: tyrosine-type recombinase/integrase [Prevotella sp.]|nr:tyrosine-type recombinase/integrase [Prevotella sp.]
MGVPVLKVLYDRQKRASKTKEGAIEVRITYNRVQRFVTTGVRVLPNQWRDGRIVKRVDAFELQHALDVFVAHVRKTVNELMEKGELDMKTVVSVIGGKQRQRAVENVPENMFLLDYFRERAAIRKYGRSEDSQERYDRFLRWFEDWGGMLTFSDVTEINVLRMDESLSGMKPYSKWNNYHRFLNSFILDAIGDGLMRKNPYKGVHINREKSSGGIGKYLTREEFRRIECLNPPTNFLRHAKDMFVFQTYTCLSYTDLASFDAGRIQDVKGKRMYFGYRGKTKQEFMFLVLQPAWDVLVRNGGRLPMMSNVKYNECLKVLAVMAGIDKPISSHWARHTGATMLLNSGMNMEIVSKVLGHSSTKITREVYAKLLDETVADAMTRFEDMLKKA